MPFVFKDFKVLKANLNFVKKILLDSHGLKEDEITKLPEPRRSEIQYLELILQSLMEESEKSPSRKADLIGVYYGAMFVVTKDIFLTRSMLSRTGSLASHLASDLSIDDKTPDADKPDPATQTRCIIGLNAYLHGQILKAAETDPRIKEGHLLSTMDSIRSPFANLSRLIKVGLELEQEFQKTLLLSLHEGPVTKKADYKPKDVPETALLELTWEQLKSKLETVKIKEITSTPKYTIAIGHVDTIDDLNPERVTQLQYLSMLATLLEASSFSETNKKAILTGAMHFVALQIAATYTLRPATNSTVYAHLVEFLLPGLKAPSDIEALLQAANQFTRHLTIHTPSAAEQTRGAAQRVLIKDHPFAAIPGFNVIEILTGYQSMIWDCRQKSFAKRVEISEAIIKAQHRSDEKHASLLGTISATLFGATAKASSAPAPEACAAEERTEASAASAQL